MSNHQNFQNQQGNLLGAVAQGMQSAAMRAAPEVNWPVNHGPIPDKTADMIRAARVAARLAYTEGKITREQYECQNNLINELVNIQIRWYKAYIHNFDELSFVGAAGDGGAVF